MRIILKFIALVGVFIISSLIYHMLYRGILGADFALWLSILIGIWLGLKIIKE